jgi:hypothetical protein
MLNILMLFRCQLLSGYIDGDELKKLLGNTCSEEQIEEIVRAADKDNDGRINYDDFFSVFRDHTMILAQEVGDLEGENTLREDEFDDFDFEFDPNSDM